MVIGNLPIRQHNDGFEGEKGIIFTLDGDEDRSLHIWEGYLSDIPRNTILDSQGWKEFTRDCRQWENIFSGHCSGSVTIDIREYLEDLRQYAGKQFDFVESSGCLDLLCRFLEEAESTGHSERIIKNPQNPR